MLFDIEAARKAGKTDDEIAGYLGQAMGFDVEEAKTSGKTSTEIANYLSTQDRPKTEVPPGKSIGGFISNVGTNVADVAKGLATAITHPIRTAGNVGETAGQIIRGGLEKVTGEPATPEAREVFERISKPVVEAATHPLKIPGMVFDYLYEKPVDTALIASGGFGLLGKGAKLGGLGKTAKVLETAATVTDPLTVPLKVIKTGRDVLLKPKTVESIIEKGVEKGVRPSVTGKSTSPQYGKYIGKAQDAVKAIVANKPNLQLTDKFGEIVQGQLPKTLKQFSQAIDQTKRSVFDEYNRMAQQAGQQPGMVKLKPISQELEQISSNKVLIDHAPQAADYAAYRAQKLLVRNVYTMEDAQEALTILNKNLEAFYKNPSYEGASKAYIDSMIANRLRESLDSVIEGAVGPGYQQLKNRYGALKTIEKDVVHRSVVDARRNIKGLLDFSDIFSGYHVIRGILSMNPVTVTAGMSSRLIAALYKLWNDPNRIVSKMFSKVEKLQQPTPLKKVGAPIRKAAKIGTRPEVLAPLGFAGRVEKPPVEHSRYETE